MKKEGFIFGIHPVIETLESGKEIERILLQKGLRNEALKDVATSAKKLGVPLVQVPIEKLNRLTRKNHQGVIAYLSPFEYQSLDHIVSQTFSAGKDPFVIILDRITDVRNVGAIARTAECSGVHALIVPTRGSAQMNEEAMKTSAGALSHLPICRETNLKGTLNYLLDSGFKVVACTEKASDLLYEANDLSGPCAVIFGSEEDGISEEYLKMTTHQVRIPLQGKIQSLNVSVATAVVLYEIVRRKQL